MPELSPQWFSLFQILLSGNFAGIVVAGLLVAFIAYLGATQVATQLKAIPDGMERVAMALDHTREQIIESARETTRAINSVRHELQDSASGLREEIANVSTQLNHRIDLLTTQVKTIQEDLSHHTPPHRQDDPR